MTTRRDVLRGLGGLTLIGTLPTTACGGDDGGGSTDASTDSGGGGACDSISHDTDMHSHGLSLPVADVTAGTQKSYTLTGVHSHPITVTAAMFTMLQNGQTVSLTSGGASAGSEHMHAVTLTCES